MCKTELDREIVLQTLAGYAEVNRITEAERRARLIHITDEQARLAFDSLNQDIDRMTQDEKVRLSKFRLVHHLKIREAMERLARMKGYESSI